MRYAFVVAGALLGLANLAVGQAVAQDTVPRSIGNRANGFSYQPTPNEVVPRERAAGVRPPVAAEAATNQELETIDRDLLRQEGAGSSSTPKFTPR